MALALVELDAYVQDHVVDKTTDVIYASSALLTRLTTKNAEKFTGNSRIRRPIV